MRELLQLFFGLAMAGMLFEKIEKDSAGFFGIAFEIVEASEIQIRLIECGCDADRFLEAVFRLSLAVSAEIEDAEIIEGFRIVGPRR